MTTVTLTDRYVEAAMRTVPEKQRADLGAELRASIEDQIDARMEQGMPREVAERDVLTRLGDPDRLAADYTDRPAFLIGPRYYFAWWRLLKILWAIVPACAAFGVALGQVLAGSTFGEVVGSVVSVTLAVIVHIGFWTTLVFFIIERSAKTADRGFVGDWSLDSLPEPRESGARLSDLVASLIFLAVGAGAIVWDHLIGFVYLSEAGGWVPFLDPALWPWWIGGLFALMAFEAVLAIGVYAKGRWDIGTATINLVLNLAVALPAVWLLMNERLLNPGFFAAILPADSAETVTVVVTTVLGFGIVAIAAADSVSSFRTARRAR